MSMEMRAVNGAGPAVPQATQGTANAPAARAVATPAAVDKVVPIPKAEIRVDTEHRQQEIKAAVNTLNEHMRDGGRGLNFAIDRAAGGSVVTVTNKDTGEVIRQIPNEAAVQMAHSLEQLKGFLLNAKT